MYVQCSPPGIILTDDKLARNENNGKWKCGKCVQKDLKQQIARALDKDSEVIRR